MDGYAIGSILKTCTQHLNVGSMNLWDRNGRLRWFFFFFLSLFPYVLLRLYCGGQKSNFAFAFFRLGDEFSDAPTILTLPTICPTRWTPHEYNHDGGGAASICRSSFGGGEDDSCTPFRWLNTSLLASCHDDILFLANRIALLPN